VGSTFCDVLDAEESVEITLDGGQSFQNESIAVNGSRFARDRPC
jgi:hypothetical protein